MRESTQGLSIRLQDVLFLTVAGFAMSFVAALLVFAY
jgi:hypothetical protein